MPLSEHEQRMLEQMERALYAEDPKFASALEGSGLRTYTRRRVYQAVAGFLIGIALLMTGMVMQQIWVSVVGFLVMLGCAVLAVTGWRKAPKPGEQPQGTARRQVRPKRSVMDRIEQRWQRRRDEQGH
ncbi:spore wall synthesis complex protein [Streptomyces rameus]|uniref:Spore wall synthesis complex protein n=1 Tax=Streptomyces rameus TaxID=68261 RepID=A0ABP6N6P9_9ACTN